MTSTSLDQCHEFENKMRDEWLEYCGVEACREIKTQNSVYEPAALIT